MTKAIITFEKVVSVGIDSKLEKKHWDRIDALAKKRLNFPKDDPEIKKNLKDADALFVPFGYPVTKADIDSAKKLKYIGVFATAYGKVDFTYAKTKSITVTNIPGYSTESVSEFVIATILERIRNLEKGKAQARNGNYSFDGFVATEIRGKVFAVIGLGRIGMRVAELALGFGADVRYWSKQRKPEAEKRGIKYQDMDSLLKEADFISLNVAQTKDTERFINTKRINSLKKGTVVVNTCPMEIVDIDALEQRLGKKDITFILDHADETPKEEMARLSKHENCVIYPPIAFLSNEAKEQLKEIFVNNIEKYAKRSPVNTVN